MPAPLAKQLAVAEVEMDEPSTGNTDIALDDAQLSPAAAQPMRTDSPGTVQTRSPELPTQPAVPEVPPRQVPQPAAARILPKTSKGLTDIEMEEQAANSALQQADAARSHAIDMASAAAEAQEAAVAAARAAAIVHATFESKRVAAQLRAEAEVAAAAEIERAHRKAAEIIAVADAVGVQVRLVV